MAIGYLEHDAWLPEYMHTRGTASGNSEFCFAVIPAKSDPEVGIAFWHGSVFRFREEGEEWYTPEELDNMVREMDMGRDSDTVSTMFELEIDGYDSLADIDPTDRTVDIIYFDNKKQDEDTFVPGLTQGDYDMIDECMKDLQRYWKGKSWKDVEQFAD